LGKIIFVKSALEKLTACIREPIRHSHFEMALGLPVMIATGIFPASS
jgi:hypothetical protein